MDTKWRLLFAVAFTSAHENGHDVLPGNASAKVSANGFWGMSKGTYDSFVLLCFLLGFGVLFGSGCFLLLSRSGIAGDQIGAVVV